MRTPREYLQLVYCPVCDYAKRITVQERRGTHGCAQCQGQMEVYESRPQRFGGVGIVGFERVEDLHAALRRAGKI